MPGCHGSPGDSRRAGRCGRELARARGASGVRWDPLPAAMPAAAPGTRHGLPLRASPGTCTRGALTRRAAFASLLQLLESKGLAMRTITADLGAGQQDLKTEMTLDLFAQPL